MHTLMRTLMHIAYALRDTGIQCSGPVAISPLPLGILIPLAATTSISYYCSVQCANAMYH